jgi:hypothetical protein
VWSAVIADDKAMKNSTPAIAVAWSTLTAAERTPSLRLQTAAGAGWFERRRLWRIGIGFGAYLHGGYDLEERGCEGGDGER